ncbi:MULTISPECIES: phosphatidate cytidylyltransferase [Nitrosomonas]|uniref:Phosphatidate cytidylyltransferase n=1 Tax=Nitrosomonas communis TaxID=44574 RepID=A0A0F7KGA7_9PROT|nr:MULTISPECIES: phosphatidate cytidylyltransferase [Nitrosomonas]AKH37892.1 phosphatidate cytidylyltransferase [Nitrosomonas communis]TYP92822.1 phosphatidate cytidylyltransferase [Nitrosomonas communis]UVS63249.1 phosphatidate cytidylyltransferase [Nitrosomonas sp. PLL12]
MLKTRILTAIILIALFIPALFYLPAIFWAMLLLGLTIVASREWCRLAKFTTHQTILYLILTTLLGGELLLIISEAVTINPNNTSMMWIYVVSCIFWGGVAPILLWKFYAVKSVSLLMLMGWLILLPTCLALYQLRAIDPWLLLGSMGVVWVSDIAAYFVGRSFGKHKLAPNISPGKTWEGVAGALIVVVCYALIWGQFIGKGDNILIINLVLLSLLLAGLGIIGDLFESLMKRQAGVKDSGNILPGHGGILDRIDALTSTLPIAVLAFLIFYSFEL